MSSKETVNLQQQNDLKRILIGKAICELTGKISDEKNLERIYRLVLFLWVREE